MLKSSSFFLNGMSTLTGGGVSFLKQSLVGEKLSRLESSRRCMDVPVTCNVFLGCCCISGL